MATGDTKKTSQLGIATTLQANDRVVVLTNPATSPQTQTVTVNNFTRSIVSSGGFPTANSTQKGVVKIGEGINVTTDGIISNGYLPPGTYNVTLVTDTLYYVALTDTVIFADPGAGDHDISIVLPISGAVEGRQIIIKNINPGASRKVRITTTTSIIDGTPLLEDPVKGIFVAYYDIVTRGEGECFIHDGNVWRHTATLKANPIFYWDANTYHQVVVQNASSGINASGDLVVYNNIGNYTQGTGPFIDMGIDSSTYSNDMYTVFGPNDGYLYTGSSRLLIGTDSEKDIVFFTGGTSAENKVLSINTTSVTTNVAIKPSLNDYTDLGSSNRKWHNVYANVVLADTITAPILNGTANNSLFLGDIPASEYAYANAVSSRTTGNVSFVGVRVIGDGGKIEIVPNNSLYSSRRWTFDDVGNLTVPINTETYTSPDNLGKFSSLYHDQNEIGIYTERALAGTNTAYAWTGCNVANVDAPNVRVQTLNQNGDSFDWSFNGDTADFVLPTNGGIVFDRANTTIRVGMGFHIASGEGIALDAIDQTDPENPVYKSTYFGTDGSVQLPGALIGNTVSAMWNEETPYQLNVHTTINKIAPQTSNGPDQYYLADGVEGQIMYIVAGGTLNSEYTTMKFAHARYRDSTSNIVQAANVQWWLPFGGNLSGASVLMYNTQVTLTFTDGHWNLPHNIFD